MPKRTSRSDANVRHDVAALLRRVDRLMRQVAVLREKVARYEGYLEAKNQAERGEGEGVVGFATPK